jgi:putative CocE/NonD family hydrolase
MSRPAVCCLITLLAIAQAAGSDSPWQPLPPVLTPPADAATKAAARLETIPMRDGVGLAASLWLPYGAGPHPVVICRTPYDRTEYSGWAQMLTLRGIAFLSVDVRGRYDSEGEWEPVVHEGKDGQDVIAWAAAQGWCNGRIATFGGSYDAWVQLLAASRGTPELDAMVLLVAPADPFENIPYDNGGYYVGFSFWAAENRGRTVDPLTEMVDFLGIFASYPINRWDDLLGRPAPWLDRWLASWQLDQYWLDRSYEPGLDRVTQPSLLITGWFDRDQPGCIRTFQTLRRHPDASVREGQKLILGPWMHYLTYLPTWGELSFPENAEIDLERVLLDWLLSQLTGDGERPGAPVDYYLMGRNVWLTADQWPPSTSRLQSFYLAVDGSLPTGLTEAATASYVYDPSDPTPLVSPLDSHDLGYLFGHVPLDASGVIERADTLLFASELLVKPLAIAGPVTAEIYISSSAEDTDVAAQLLDLTPDGRAITIQHGLSRVRFRNGYDSPEPLLPGQVEMITIDLWSIAYEVAAGHRIGLLVSSAQFPAFDAHRNRFDNLATGTEWSIATQTVHMGTENPSRLLLPVLNPPRRLRRVNEWRSR